MFLSGFFLPFPYFPQYMPVTPSYNFLCKEDILPREKRFSFISLTILLNFLIFLFTIRKGQNKNQTSRKIKNPSKKLSKDSLTFPEVFL